MRMRNAKNVLFLLFFSGVQFIFGPGWFSILYFLIHRYPEVSVKYAKTTQLFGEFKR